MKITEVITEAANPAQQAAIAISMKKAGKRPKSVTEGSYQSQFKSKEEAISHAKERLKSFRDPEDGIEIWAMPKGGFDIVHTMNSNGRNHVIDNGGKKIGTIGPRHIGIDEDWQKVNKKDKTSGMSKKAVSAYRRENPGSKLKTAVTTKPSKLKKGSKAANRRKSFCARMGGMKKSRASAKTKRDPNSPINKALRRWNCESVQQMEKLVMIAEQKIRNLKK